MKFILAATTTVLIAGIAIAAALAANTPSRPPGVSANEWAPISDTMGVVLMDPVAGAADAPGTRIQRQGASTAPAGRTSGGASLIPPATGYLMVKRGHTWQRLIVIDPVKGPGEAG